jgi:hypothetical protein
MVLPTKIVSGRQGKLHPQVDPLATGTNRSNTRKEAHHRDKQSRYVKSSTRAGCVGNQNTGRKSPAPTWPLGDDKAICIRMAEPPRRFNLTGLGVPFWTGSFNTLQVKSEQLQDIAQGRAPVQDHHRISLSLFTQEGTKERARVRGNNNFINECDWVTSLTLKNTDDQQAARGS